MKTKKVRVYSRPGSERCLVKLLYVYLSKLAPDSSHFYMGPLKDIPLDYTKPWYVYTAACWCKYIKGSSTKALKEVRMLRAIYKSLPSSYSNHQNVQCEYSWEDYCRQVRAPYYCSSSQLWGYLNGIRAPAGYAIAGEVCEDLNPQDGFPLLFWIHDQLYN